jgi:hypothetical protein
LINTWLKEKAAGSRTPLEFTKGSASMLVLRHGALLP